ncbi:MAG: hypothetical protein M3O68_03055 [Thermoproteota archaeon]|nr:hypothetical protein [Thermoproteota archaeon]
MDSVILFPTNADDLLSRDHKYTSRPRIPQASVHNIIFLLVLFLVKMSVLGIMSKAEIEIVKSWRNTDGCRTIVFPLPYKLAEKYHIEKPAKLYLIPREDGILLKKVDLEGIE